MPPRGIADLLVELADDDVDRVSQLQKALVILKLLFAEQDRPVAVEDLIDRRLAGGEGLVAPVIVFLLPRE